MFFDDEKKNEVSRWPATSVSQAEKEKLLKEEYADESDAQGAEVILPPSVKNLSARDMRSLVFHILYAMEAHDYETPLQTIIDSFNRGFDVDIDLNHKAVKIAREIIQQREALDVAYVPFLKNWRIERVGICTKLVLRYAMWELLHTQTDARIIINEAVELAKRFAEQDAHRFINGILDRAAKALRKHQPEEE